MPVSGQTAGETVGGDRGPGCDRGEDGGGAQRNEVGNMYSSLDI